MSRRSMAPLASGLVAALMILSQVELAGEITSVEHLAHGITNTLGIANTSHESSCGHVAHTNAYIHARARARACAYTCTGADEEIVEVIQYSGGMAFKGNITMVYESEDQMCSSFLMLPGQNLWNRCARSARHVSTNGAAHSQPAPSYHARGLVIFLYFFGLMWCFLGVSIVADMFMGE